MRFGKRLGLAIAIVSLGWLCASAFQSSGPTEPSSGAPLPAIRRELPLRIPTRDPTDGEPTESNERPSAETGRKEDLPRLDRVPRIGQNRPL